MWNASQTKLEEIGSLTHRNPRRSHGNTIKQILGLKLNKSLGWNHRKSKNGNGTKIDLEQKKYWGWNKRNPSFESKEMLGVQPKTHLAWNASSFPKSANTAESDCHREPNISILGYCRWLAEVYNYYKMIRVQNKESKMNIQFPSLNMKKERGLRLVSSGRHNKVCHPFEIAHFLESRMKANFLLNPISSSNVSPTGQH